MCSILCHLMTFLSTIDYCVTCPARLVSLGSILELNSFWIYLEIVDYFAGLLNILTSFSKIIRCDGIARPGDCVRSLTFFSACFLNIDALMMLYAFESF